jgi:ribosomal protein L2
MTSALEWFKSSYSGSDEPDCVEVAMAPTDTTIHVRDSKNQQGAQLAFASGSWAAFVEGARRRASQHG